MAQTGPDTGGQKFTVGGFYGVKNKRKWIGLERSVENQVKKHQQEKTPDPYQSRILGPSTKWETFFRQKDAFAYARSSTGSLHVFAFESDTFGEQSGQRMFLVASYPVFWHYYSQLNLQKRHHYEVIPEGCVCKLYFDLEYAVASNPDRHGDLMVDILIKFVCLCLEEEFGWKCSRKNVLDMEASTKAKFSRHLIFLPKNTAFTNNIHVGNFVSHCFSQLRMRMKEMQVKSTEHACNDSGEITVDTHAKHVHSDLTESMNKRSINSPTGKLNCQNCSKSSEVLQCSSGMCKMKTCSDIVDGSAVDTVTHSGVNHICKTDSNSVAVTTCREIDPENVTSDKGENHSASETIENVEQSNDDVADGGVVSGYKNIFDQFSDQELKLLIVKNKHKEDVLFCDTGVYTKNRNFRLYKSSKLGKDNPLVVSAHNTYTPADPHATDQQVFYDSLISNVEFTDKLRVLTFGDDKTTAAKFCAGAKHQHKDEGGETMGGYSKSPYPEIDTFISGLVSGGGAAGIIRYWTYFQQGELLLYEISHYRYCHNIGRSHRSNNIMYIADLRRGVYYQKCHDPECQVQNFKSHEWRLPREVLPAHYMDDYSVEDSLEFQTEDDDFLNTTAEMERQYLEGSRATCEQDDLDDEELTKAAEEMENGYH